MAGIPRTKPRATQASSPRFQVDDEVAGRYPIRTVGAAIHQELWIPAEELEEFNAAIQGPIEVIAGFKGELFPGDIDPASHLPTHLNF